MFFLPESTPFSFLPSPSLPLPVEETEPVLAIKEVPCLKAPLSEGGGAPEHYRPSAVPFPTLSSSGPIEQTDLEMPQRKIVSECHLHPSPKCRRL